MKILHTADWHLGKRLERFSRLDEQRLVLEELINLADEHEVDAVLVAGDLFDAYNPSSEAIELLYKVLKKLTNNGRRPVIAIAGNHDSPERIEAPDPLARECGILFAGYPYSHIAPFALETGVAVTRSEPGFLEIRLPQYDYPLRLLLTPYANEFRLRTFLGLEDAEAQMRDLLHGHWQRLADTYCDEKGVNFLMAHLYMMKQGEQPPEEPEDEKPILHIGGAQAVYTQAIPSQIQYAALGHLHRFQEMDKDRMPIVYSSSPLAYSFSEAGQQKYAVLVEVLPASFAQFEKLALHEGKQLYRKRFSSVEEALLWLGENPEALVELTMVSGDFMSADDRRRLLQSHNGIVTIIPEVTHKAHVGNERQAIDMNLRMEELFAQYFEHRYGQEPNEELLALFKEVRAEENEQ
ncbi:metallophosphoesterase family protein [Olivibacter sitiensis]|uniref:metallophosphoesterase family protein n=1 Tax=Olivibacter sitiensis TaxID=376470 RepID=UPI000421BE25|nr:exonuclease subunit SbcD [Olivibacter sitiensis]